MKKFLVNFILISLFSNFLSQTGKAAKLEICTLNIPLLSFSQKQIYLLSQYCSEKLFIQNVDTCWNSLEDSQRSTFFSITHALSHTRVDQDNALDLVESVEEISGRDSKAESSQQFNLQVKWIDNSRKILLGAGFKHRYGSGHPGETGLGQGFPGNSGLHFLFSHDDLQRGHVHVDYRPSGWVKAVQRSILHFGSSHGHFKPYNGDIRAVGPQEDQSHEFYNNLALHEQWYGSLDLVASCPEEVDPLYTAKGL